MRRWCSGCTMPRSEVIIDEAFRRVSPREYPILFTGPMVRALIDGSKTQTRRLVKGEALSWLDDAGFSPEFVASPMNHLSPYGYAGDTLWVRETFTTIPLREPDGGQGDKMGYAYRADGEEAFAGMPDEWEFMGKWTPSIFMPRVACRCTPLNTGIRIERLQAISEADAVAEGCRAVLRIPGDGDAALPLSARDIYFDLWDSINRKRAPWSSNPWVWVVGMDLS